MPQYLTHKDNTYYFRQNVPAELRSIVGRREIKKPLGRDYAWAVRECKRAAVDAVANNLLADARTKLDSLPVAPYSREGIRRTWQVALSTAPRTGETVRQPDARSPARNRSGNAYRQHGPRGIRGIRPEH